MVKLIFALILLLSSVTYGIGEQLVDGDSAAVTVATPYESSELFELQYVQSADEMYIVHPNHPPYILTRTSATVFTMTEFDFQKGPFKLENTSAVTITPSATTGSITLTASSSTFNVNHIGALWEIIHTVAATEVAGSFTGTGNSTAVTVQLGRGFSWSTHGTWSGTAILQRSYDAGSNWATVGEPIKSANDGNITFSDIETVADATYRVRMNAYTSGTCTYSLISKSFDVHGVADITAYSDVNTVTATVEETLGGTTAVTTWSEGAWSLDEGYPSTVAFYEERLCFGGTSGSPQTIWLSYTDDWENFRVGANDADAMSITIAADQVNAIRWMAPQTALLIGTTGGEWTLSAGGASEAITPTNVVAKRHSTYGSANVQAKAVNNEVFYLQRNAKKVRNISYSFNEDTWVSPDLTVLAEHITESSIVDWAYQRNPYPMLWCVTSDGNLAVLTIMKEMQVAAWHSHETEGNFKSVAVIPGTYEDRVWFVVEHTIDSNTVKYIEQLQPFDWGDDQEDIFFVDCGLTFDYGAAITITGISKANPCVITAAAHGFTEDDNIRISGVVGMTELNNNVYTVGTVVGDNSFQLQDSADVGDINSVSFTTYVSGGTATQVENTFDVNHLDTEAVIVSADGGYYGTYTIVTDSNQVILTDYFNTTQIGLAYTAKVKPMKLASPGSPGDYFGTNKRITDITLRLYNTLAVDIGDSWTSYYPVIFRDADDPLEAAPSLYTEDKEISINADYGRGGDIFIQSRLPLPFTLLALRAEIEVYK